MYVTDDGKELPEGQSPPVENGEQEDDDAEDEGSDSNTSGEEEEEEEDPKEELNEGEKDTKEPEQLHSKDEEKSNGSSPPEFKPSPPPPPPSTEASILDKLASFTNGSSGKPPYHTSSVLAAAASATTEESALNKLSNFVKDPGTLLSTKPTEVAPVRVPRNVKVPTPPSLPAAYQQYIAAAAAAAASSYMLAAPPPTAASPSLSDPDAPLDLSVKAKGLDLSTKSPKTSKSSSSTSSSSSSSSKYISPPPPPKYRTKESASSSLKSLEQKFGGNAFPFDSRNSLKSQLYRHPMMPAFGGNLYTSALFNTQTLATTDLVYKPEPSYQPPTSHSQRHSPRREREPRETKVKASQPTAPQPPKPSTPVSASSATSPPIATSSPTSSAPPSTSTPNTDASFSTTAISSVTASSPTPKTPVDKRHTTLLCKCGKDYINLYDLTLHLRETGHSPNDKGGVQPEYPKLVRGQDMWLNQGSEQTRQILRCMQCGESFKSLPELTVHMIDTKHYTNIVGTEAAVTGPGVPPVIPRKAMKASSDSGSDSEVFKCQVCELSFENMEGLSSHMMTSGHHKRPVIIQPESPSPRSPVASSPKPPRPASPMSLSLMEYKYKLARLAAAHGAAAEGGSPRDSSSPGSDFLAEISKITCETCGDRIDMGRFVEHVRVCIGKRSNIKHKTNGVDSAPMSPPSPLPKTPQKKRKVEEDDTQDSKDEDVETTAAKIKENKAPTIKKERSSSESPSFTPRSDFDSCQSTPISSSLDRLIPPPPATADEGKSSSDASALKAMESFIERSFTSVSSHLRNRYFPFKGPVRNTFMNDVPQESPRSTDPRSTAEPINSKYHNKYLPPLYVNPDSKPISSPPAPTVPKPDDSKAAMKRKNSGSRSPSPPMKIKKEKDDKSPPTQPHTPSPPVATTPNTTNTSSLPPASKYIQEDDQPKSDTLNKSSSVSALESLQGLVYGKNFNAEHPLDSLQKLLHAPQTPPSVGVRATTPGESAHLKMNGTLVNNNREGSGTPRKNGTPPVVATANVTLLPSSLGPGGSPLRNSGSPQFPRAVESSLYNRRNTASPANRATPVHSPSPNRVSPHTPPRPATTSPPAPNNSSPAPPRSDGEDDGYRDHVEGDLECPWL